MLKRRIISSSVAMALTASVAMLSGCPSPNTNPSPSETASPSASASPSETASPSAEPTSTASPSGTASPSASATPSNVTPTSATGNTPDIEKKATVDGKVFDKKGFPVDGATVTLTLLDPGVKFADGSASVNMTTNQGAYVFRDVPTGTRIEIKATKEGWTTQSRVESVKSNLQGNTDINKFNFGSEGNASGTIYALQDEPQVEVVKVNGTALDKYGSQYAGRPTESTTAALTSLKPELTFELMFTEAVKQSSVQNAFRVDSEATLSGRVPNAFTLTESAFDWTWSSDGKMATVKARKPLLQENTGNQMRYKVYFNQAFEDTQGVSADAGSYFKFGTSTEKDYFTLALENDTVDPKLVRVDYNDTGVVDQVTLTFSESFDVHGRRVDEVLYAGQTVGGSTPASSYEIKVGKSLPLTVFTTVPSKVELSSDGKSVRMEWPNTAFSKDDIISVEVKSALKDPAGRSFSTSDTGKVESVDTSDSLKVVKVIN